VKKFKDLVYDYNDIVVALLIVVIAGAVISWRIGSIVEYPKYLASIHAGENGDSWLDDLDLNPVDTEDGLNENPDEIVVDPSGEQGDPDGSGQENGEPDGEGGQGGSVDVSGPFKTKSDATFTVPAGVTGSKIAQLLADAHLVESSDAFLTAISKANAETRLKAGTFTIPAGSTADDVVKILTK